MYSVKIRPNIGRKGVKNCSSRNSRERSWLADAQAIFDSKHFQQDISILAQFSREFLAKKKSSPILQGIPGRGDRKFSREFRGESTQEFFWNRDRDEERRYPASMNQGSPGERRISAALEIGWRWVWFAAAQNSNPLIPFH
jgi:hypothetical protein